MTYLYELQRILNRRLLIVALLTGTIYIMLSVYGINRGIIADTLFGPYPLAYKITLLQSILVGSWSMFSPTSSALLILIAVLMGANIALMVRIFTNMQTNKGLRVSFGGSSIIAIASAGCPACGMSLLSLAGISIPFLPIQGVLLQLFALALLTGSIWYSLKKLQQPMVCKVPSGKTIKQRGAM